MSPFPSKWRPTLTMVVVAMLLSVLCLPLGGIWLFRFYDSQLVRETERELIVQGAFVNALVVRELGLNLYDPTSLTVDASDKENGVFDLVLPQLDLSSSPILPPRPDALEPEVRPIQLFVNLGQNIRQVIFDAQKTTLAGFRVLDPNGVVIAGRTETGQSLAHVPEVAMALNGNYASAIRERISDEPSPPIYSVSRGTDIRVFVAMPIEYEGKIAGVVYLSRTPSHFLRELYGQRWKIGLAIIFMLAVTLIIAFIFIRTIREPIVALNARTVRIAKGDRTALEPLAHHGTREVASLSQGLLSMSEKLQDRSDYIRNFATHVSHELKSPLTSIRGAAELMTDNESDMTSETRQKFLGNIVSDTDRLSRLLDRLRDLAATDSHKIHGTCTLHDILEELRQKNENLEIHVDNCDCRVPLPLENAAIIFSNLADNASRHGAARFSIETSQSGTESRFKVSDDGEGISSANRDKIFELFFTTRRDHGGTGMGLGIVRSILDAYGGSITLLETQSGAVFEISLPHAN
ncbi:MAG: ATP-binding protein [Pseudomonadota bacterium]